MATTYYVFMEIFKKINLVLYAIYNFDFDHFLIKRTVFVLIRLKDFFLNGL